MSRVLRRRALLVHTETYQDDRFSALPSTRADTWQLRQVLEHRNIGAFDSVRVVGDLRADDMRAEIAEFLESCDPDELALLYLTGHGARTSQTTGEFHFVAADTDHDRISQTGVSAGFVNERLEECCAPHKVAVLDCCFSGGFALGLRTADHAPGAAKSAASPLHSRGVYVLSSSGPSEESFSGPGAEDGPTPSVFTGAVVEALRTGKAAKDGSGTVSVDDLIDHVTRQLRGRGGQVPTRSALGVNDRIVIASCPVGEAPTLAPLAQAPRPEPRAGSIAEDSATRSPKRLTTWQDVIAYYRACVLDENEKMSYLPVDGGGRTYACLTGAERLLSGDLDEGGTAEITEEAAEFLAGVDGQDELWAGYPAVVLHQPRGGKPWGSPRFAPLLMRRVEIIGGEDGAPPRFRPYGPVVPHPGLAEDQLGEEQASHLVESYQPTWHAGQHGRLATDARNLLQQEFELPCVQELRPDFLEERIDTNSPGDGARNAAVLVRVARSGGASANLIKDLDHIAGQHEKIADTAMGALLDGSNEETNSETGSAVAPLPANEAQRAVLRAAMSQRLTVATGPPGTGKSQLVANAVATAVANQESVLVASTNNQAVDEVWQRCDRLLADSVVRTGSSFGAENYRQHEADALQRLLKVERPDLNPATALAEHARKARRKDQVRQVIGRKAEVEQQLHGAATSREHHAEHLGRTVESLAELLGAGSEVWERRAGRLARARFFGEWRRRRSLRVLGIEPGEDTRAVCGHLAGFAAAEARWRRHRSEASTTPPDAELAASLEDADAAVQEASLAVWRASTTAAVAAGKAAILSLVQATASGSRDWAALRGVLRHVRGWATTSLSARRFPTQPRLFDLVIIDEASQCSIPQVLPLLFRARRALIIGDVMQLAHITTIPPEREALIRRRTGVSSAFLEKHKLSFRRHSAFHAAEGTCGGSLLLDEHYRCHPDIASVSNGLFYGDALTVLTDVRGRPAVDRPAVTWSNAEGRAQRGPSGSSWVNREEVRTVERCVEYLRAHLPAEATIGVVTPFRAQQAQITRALGECDRVRIGTVHTFQGGERDAVVFSLVAGAAMHPGAIDWVNGQLNLWNVAMTRARSHLVVVGDREFWRRRGGTGEELVRAAEEVVGGPTSAPGALVQRLYDVAAEIPDARVELGGRVNGHAIDALIEQGDGTARPVLLDRGGGEDVDPERHLGLMLRRRALLSSPDEGAPAVRLPAWTLYDQRAALAELGLTTRATPLEVR
ncbi:AAA domain-containing protein [Saccharopolyspora cebuensis]|uniref:AAA domain-containing protein n=1 Tax=Saccharopolyspora cebuensis TaxID=418759 RepID=A0ABV4CG83_9PSEU